MCRKVDLCNKKTKIYLTIKGLIILFIKFQFSIRCNQVFRLLHTSTSEHLPQSQPQSQWLHHLHYTQYICIIPIYHDFRHALAEMSASNQVKPRLTCSPLGLRVIGLPIRKFLLFPVNALIFM